MAAVSSWDGSVEIVESWPRVGKATTNVSQLWLWWLVGGLHDDRLVEPSAEAKMHGGLSGPLCTCAPRKYCKNTESEGRFVGAQERIKTLYK